MIRLFFLFLFLRLFSLQAMVVGNPLNPELFCYGFLWKNPKNISLRAEYFADYSYESKFKEELISEETGDHSIVEFSTYGSCITLNLYRWIDLYTLLGSSKIEFKNEFLASRRFSWGAGIKAVLYKIPPFYFGGDVKYFFTKQKPLYIMDDNLPALILTSFNLDYTEIQGAISVCYDFNVFIPYLGLSYLESKVSPQNALVVDTPSLGTISEFAVPSTVNEHKWGVILGITLLSAKTMTINLESRFVNQNAVNISGELQF